MARSLTLARWGSDGAIGALRGGVLTIGTARPLTMARRGPGY